MADDEHELDEIPTAFVRQESKDGEISHPEVNIILEIVPSLKRKIVMEILKGNNFDLTASIDAALALAVSLSEEQGSAFVHKPSKPGESQRSRDAPRQGARRASTGMIASHSTSATFRRLSAIPSDERLLSPGADQSVSNTRSEEVGLTSTTHSPSRPKSMPLSRTSSRTFKSPSYDSTSKIKRGRGANVNLPPNFLPIPRFRFMINKQFRGSIDFSVVFQRRGERLGFSFQDVNGDICIQNMVGCDGNIDTIGLAMQAGVMIGDRLIGVNNEYFCPGIELQDVVDLLFLESDIILLHFTRIRNSSFERFVPHKFANILSDQSVIHSDNIGIVTKQLIYLLNRFLTWDSQLIMKRIQSWKLYIVAISPASVPSMMTTTVAFHSTSLPMGGAAWKGPDVLSDSSAVARATDSSVPSKTLRPSLAVRIMRAETKKDFVVYVIWVMDVVSGAEWVVQRRFREFSEFRDALASIRPSITRLNFPPKRINVAETSSMVSERQMLLQKFIRRVCGITTVNSLHPSSIRIQLALQQFLGVEDRVDTIELLERRPTSRLRNLVQAFVHSALLMQVMDRVLNGFIDHYMDNWEEDMDRDWTPEQAMTVVTTMCDFIDRLQAVLCDGLMSDCLEIIREFQTRRKGVTIGGGDTSHADIMDSEGLETERRLSIVSNMRERLHGIAADDVSNDCSRREMFKSIQADDSIQGDISLPSTTKPFTRNSQTVDDENLTHRPTDDIAFVRETSLIAGDSFCVPDEKLSVSRVDAKVNIEFANPIEVDIADDASDEDRLTIPGYVCQLPKGSEVELVTYSSNVVEESLAMDLDQPEHGNDYKSFRLQVPLSTSPNLHTDTKSHAEQTCGETDHAEKLARALEEDKLMWICRNAIRRQLEIEIYIACAIRLRGVLEIAFRDEEYELQLRMQTFKTKPQSYYGIPEEQISPTSWDDIVYALQGIRKHTLPIDKLQCLTEVANMVPKVFAVEHPEAKKPLGADEFLPIFIYVVVQACVPNILSLNFELQHLCDSESRMSESGYYLATFEAAIQHISEGTFGSDGLQLSSRISQINTPMTAHTPKEFGTRYDEEMDEDDKDMYRSQLGIRHQSHSVSFYSPELSNGPGKTPDISGPDDSIAEDDIDLIDEGRSIMFIRPSGLDDVSSFGSPPSQLNPREAFGLDGQIITNSNLQVEPEESPRPLSESSDEEKENLSSSRIHLRENESKSDSDSEISDWRDWEVDSEQQAELEGDLETNLGTLDLGVGGLEDPELSLPDADER